MGKSNFYPSEKVLAGSKTTSIKMLQVIDTIKILYEFYRYHNPIGLKVLTKINARETYSLPKKRSRCARNIFPTWS